MDGGAKKKLSERAVSDGQLIDPLQNMTATFSSYDIQREVSIYSDNSGERWWTKAWFNGREKGEPSVEINRKFAIAFIDDVIKKDEWLSRFFPKQMTAIIKSLETTRNQLLSY